MTVKHIAKCYDKWSDCSWFTSFEQCESEAERTMLLALSKTFVDIRQQVPAFGYRLDFVLDIGGGVAIEVDGAKYHDAARDLARDTTILQGRKVDEIIRVPAAAVMFFRDGLLRLLASWHPRLQCPVVAFDLEASRREADMAVRDAAHYGDHQTREIAYHLAMSDAFVKKGMIGKVGSPLAFIDSRHEIFRYVDYYKIPLYRKQQTILRRTLGSVTATRKAAAGIQKP